MRVGKGTEFALKVWKRVRRRIGVRKEDEGVRSSVVTGEGEQGEREEKVSSVQQVWCEFCCLLDCFHGLPTGLALLLSSWGKRNHKHSVGLLLSSS